MVTCALPYVNYIPHVGHLAGCHLPGDIFSRFQKLLGNDCIYIGGTDEHGTPTSVQAQKLGVSPKKLCDTFYKEHKKIYDWFLIGYDNFSRTSRQIHHKTTQNFFLKIQKNGYVDEKTVELAYCKTCKRTLPDRYVNGKCYYCGYENARGDQCESCTKVMDVKKMKNLRCAICNSKPIFQKQRHLFIKLDRLSPKLKQLISKQTHWSPRQLCDYLRDEYGIVYKSRQSYYDILHEAKVSWKKSQKQNSQGDPEEILGTREAIKKNTGGTTPDH